MKFTKRIAISAVAAATLLGSLAAAVPASAATYYYVPTYRVSSWYNMPTSWYTLLQRYMTAQQTPTTVRQTAPTTQQQTAPVAPKPTATQTTAPATTATTASTAGLTAEEQQMLNLVNAERAKAGVPALKADLQLTKLARMKSQDMINLHYFDHTSPTYGTPFQMMQKYGVSYRTAGENIAGNSSVAGAHAALMNSPGHRANILNAQFNYVGIGIIHGGQYGMMFTQQFIGR